MSEVASKSEKSAGASAPRGRLRRLKRSKATAVECIRQLFDNPLLSDVTLVVGEERIPAHKVVLAARSAVFEAMFFPRPLGDANALTTAAEGTQNTEENSPSAAEASGAAESQLNRASDSVSVSVSAQASSLHSMENSTAVSESEARSESEGEKEREEEETTQSMREAENESVGEEGTTGELESGESHGRGAKNSSTGQGEEKSEEKERAREQETADVKEVELSYTSSEALLKFLQFLYTDELEVSDQHCLQLLFLAKKFAVRPLEERCNEFFMKSVTELSVCDLLATFTNAAVMQLPTLKDEDGQSHPSIVENLVEYIQQHSAQVLEADNFKQLSLESVKAILDTDQLNGTELQVFKAVMSWAHHQCEVQGLDSSAENVRDVAKELIPLIRFPAMEQSEIAAVVRTSGLLTIDQLVELFSFMAVQEGSELSFCKTKPREKRSITYMSGDGITLPCTNEFEGGVMNYIATKGGLESYNNPMLRGEVDVKASSWMQDADPIHFVVDRVVKRCVTRAQPMQSITIEVKRWNVRPTAYLLRHYSSWDTEALRCWVLEAATEENGEWTVLSEHKDDTHLKAKGAWHIWPLSDVSGFYRFFRVTQLGQNSNNHDYLACSGFELWGTMIHV